MSECFNCHTELLGDTDATLCDDCYRMKTKTRAELVAEIKEWAEKRVEGEAGLLQKLKNKLIELIR